MTRLLIVDDDAQETRTLARAFAQLRPDFTIWTCANGREATELLRDRAVDLVLTDLRMPEMDGFELLSFLQQGSAEVAVFSMSGFGSDESAARALSLGAVEHFTKPVDAKAVLARLSDTFNQSVHGHVQNVSLASLLQLLEMERKTCSLTVNAGSKIGWLALQSGRLVAAQCDDRLGEAAAIAIVAWPNSSITISRRQALLSGTVQEPLGFIVMEAMRIQDEAARHLPAGSNGSGSGSAWPLARRTWRPSSSPSDRPADPTRLNGIDLGVPSGVRGIAVVETATGNVLRAAAREDCPIGELSRLASHVLLQEAAMLQLCSAGEGVEELVLSTSSRCDVIRPLSETEFALMVFSPEETNLVMARIELEHFVATHLSARRSA